METLFTRKEVAAILKVTPETVRNLEKKGLILPAIRINGKPRYTKESINSLSKPLTDGNNSN